MLIELKGIVSGNKLPVKKFFGYTVEGTTMLNLESITHKELLSITHMIKSFHKDSTTIPRIFKEIFNGTPNC